MLLIRYDAALLPGCRRHPVHFSFVAWLHVHVTQTSGDDEIIGTCALCGVIGEAGSSIIF